MTRPFNMPPYPNSLTQREVACSLVYKKNQLLSDLIFMERAVGCGDFHDFANLTRARTELRAINGKLSGEVMSNYVKSLKK